MSATSGLASNTEQLFFLTPEGRNVDEQRTHWYLLPQNLQARGSSVYCFGIYSCSELVFTVLQCSGFTMICQRCRTNILSRLHQWHGNAWLASPSSRQIPWQRISLRDYSDGTAPPTPSPRQPVVGGIGIDTDVASPDIASPDSSTTSGQSQPSSAPEAPVADLKKPTSRKIQSTCPAGERLNGLNYLKNKPEVFAKEDSEYPEWLWDILEGFKSQAKAVTGGADMSSMS